MSQKRSYKQYPKEFKDEAVALVLEQGYSVANAAKSLGIPQFTVPLEGAT
jgi:transposase